MKQRLPFIVVSALAALGLAAALSTCEHMSTRTAPAGNMAPEYVENLLPGSWLREYTDKGVQVRRLLRLGTDGMFQETVRVVGTDGRITEFAHAGHWLYDGTNLKRKYTLMNGEPPSRLRPPFATFEISFQSRNDFIGVDHVHKNKVHYWRVTERTEL